MDPVYPVLHLHALLVHVPAAALVHKLEGPQGRVAVAVVVARVDRERA